MRQSNTRVEKKKSVAPIILAGMILGMAVLATFGAFMYLHPGYFQSRIFYWPKRAVNTAAHYALKKPPCFYYLEIEKNGDTLRLGAANTLEMTYRDEVVMKTVVSDDIGSRYTSASLQGTGNEGNHIGILFRGIDFVNRIMQSEKMAEGGTDTETYKIVVSYHKTPIAVLPVRVIVSPQDWLRFAKDSSNINIQIQYLQKAIAQNSNDTGLRKVLAGIYLKKNDREKAAKLYEDILRIRPDDTATQKELARIRLQTNQISQAIEILSALVKTHATDAEAYAMLGLAYGQKQMWPKAVENYQQSVKVDPDNPAVRYFLAEVLEKTKRTTEALKQYQYLAANAQDPVPALRAQGDIHLRKKHYDAAIQSYLQIIKSNPKDAAAHANLATAYAGSGKTRNEMDSLQKAVELAPKDPIIRFNLAAAYEKRKMTDEAIKAYQQVLKIHPDDTDALERLAALMLKNKKYDSAVGYYERLAGMTPNKAAVHANLGFAYGELKQYESSIASYEKAVGLGAKDQVIYHNLALTYEKLGKEKESVGYYEKITPPTKKTLAVVANYYLKEKKYTKAVSFYSQIVKLEPKKASSYAALGYAYAAGKQYDKAIEQYLTALKYEKEDDEIYANLGDAYEKKGGYEEALKAYRSAYEINPDTRVAPRIPRLRIQLMKK